MSTRNTLAAAITGLLCAFVLAACGGSSTGPDNASPGPSVSADIQVVRGGGQRDTVERVLADSIVAIVTDDAGTPIVGTVVNFEPHPDCGTVRPDDLTTNANGRVANTWTLGTKAWTGFSVGADSTCKLDLIASIEGAPDLVTTVEAVVEPGRPSGIFSGVAMEDADTLEIGSIYRDKHGNAIPYTVTADGPFHVGKIDHRAVRSWTSSLFADSVGEGTAFFVPEARRIDRLDSVSATVTVTDTFPSLEEGQLWICLDVPERLPRQRGDDCRTPR